jgi:glycerol kinase
MNYLLAIDQGTTGTTSLLIDAQTLKILDKEKIDYPQIFPQPSWVEHNLNDIWDSVGQSVSTIIKRQGIDPHGIVAIGITNQRETTCAYDKKGQPLAHAIVWQDRRTASYCDEHRETYKNKNLQLKTGLPLDPYFSATKMRWLLDHVTEVKSAADRGELHLSTIDTFLLYRLTNGKSFSTEPSNASRTMLMNLENFQWDRELIQFFGVDQTFLPQIQESFSPFGTTEKCSFLPDGIPILSILGDQQAALFGQACVNSGDLKCTYGTGAFLLLNTGESIVRSQTGLLTTAAFFHQGRKIYALEGAAYIAGAAVQWLRDNLKCISTSTEVETLAKEVTDLSQMADVLFMPFFTGIGTPYWHSEAKAAILGLTRGTTKAHIARACLEGIALSVNDSVSSFKKDFEHLNDIRVDGGACANNLLLQIQSNFSGKKIIRPEIIDTTAFGVAMGALVGKKEITLADLSHFWKQQQDFNPEVNPYYAQKKNLWDSSIKKLYL